MRERVNWRADAQITRTEQGSREVLKQEWRVSLGLRQAAVRTTDLSSEDSEAISTTNQVVIGFLQRWDEMNRRLAHRNRPISTRFKDRHLLPADAPRMPEGYDWCPMCLGCPEGSTVCEVCLGDRIMRTDADVW